MKRYFNKYIFVLILISVSDSKVFLTRLNILLNHCIKNYDNLNPELLLGVSIANGYFSSQFKLK